MAALAALVPTLTSLLGEVLEGLSGDRKTRAEQALKLLEAARAEAEAQLQVNRAEAAHRSVFVAGWRPFIGWVGGLGVAYAFLLHPAAQALLAVHSPDLLPLLPVFPMDHLLELLFGMLGLGGLRTFEKVRGVSR